MRSELLGLNGGIKSLWMKNHKEEILQFYAEKGLYLTLIEFNLQYDTFERFLRRNIREVIEVKKIPKYSNDKLDTRIKILEITVREMGSKQRQLVTDFNNFVPSVADKVTRKLYKGIAAGLVNILESESNPLPDNDLLRIEK